MTSHIALTSIHQLLVFFSIFALLAHVEHVSAYEHLTAAVADNMALYT